MIHTYTSRMLKHASMVSVSILLISVMKFAHTKDELHLIFPPGEELRYSVK